MRKLLNFLTNFLAPVSLLISVSMLGGCGYNTLQSTDEQVQSSWSEVLNQYQRRADLIPNLVNTVKGYASHEQNTLSEVVEARAQATQTRIDVNDAAAMARFAQAQGELSSALSRLMAISESYPDLKASQNFMDLQNEISDVENKIAAARRFFNSATKELNVATEVFPSNIIATLFNFKREPMFDLGDKRTTIEEPPQIKFQ